MEEEKEYRRSQGSSWEKKRGGDSRWDRPFWTRERKYSPRRAINSAESTTTFALSAGSIFWQRVVRLRPVVTFAIRAGKGCAKEGEADKGTNAVVWSWRLLYLRARCNAHTEYAAEYLGPRDRDREPARIKHRDRAISRPDRTIITIGRTKFVGAGRAPLSLSTCVSHPRSSPLFFIGPAGQTEYQFIGRRI